MQKVFATVVFFYTCIFNLKSQLKNIILELRKFEDNKGVIRSRKSKDRQYNGQKKKDKQRSTKRYSEN